MQRNTRIFVAVAVGIVASVVVATTAFPAPSPGPDGPPIGPNIARDTGAGELLLVVLGGVYATRTEAEAANASMTFGDLQGYYPVPVAQFQGFREQVGAPGDFALVSVFRTQAGADEFAALAGTFGVPAQILTQRVRSLGGLYAGLGQEASPDGTGPLLQPVAESLP